jgi:hypothetical protein
VAWIVVGSGGDKKQDRGHGGTFKHGDKVEAKVAGWPKFYAGCVKRVNRDGTYDITFDDGDRKSGVRADEIKGGGSGGKDGDRGRDRNRDGGSAAAKEANQKTRYVLRGEAARSRWHVRPMPFDLSSSSNSRSSSSSSSSSSPSSPPQGTTASGTISPHHPQLSFPQFPRGADLLAEAKIGGDEEEEEDGVDIGEVLETSEAESGDGGSDEESE